MSRYKTLRMWSVVLIALGIVSVISASFGVISWAIADFFVSAKIKLLPPYLPLTPF